MTSIYDKTLKRVALASSKPGASNAKDSQGVPPSDDNSTKTGADLGKIVNLMTADVNSVCPLFCSLNVNAPFTNNRLCRFSILFKRAIGSTPIPWRSSSVLSCCTSQSFLYMSSIQMMLGIHLLSMYSLLGISAFVGFLALLVGLPVSHYLSKRALNLYKSMPPPVLSETAWLR